MAIKLKKDKNASKVAEAPSNGFDPLPKGKYEATIFDAELREFGPKSKNAGDPGYNIQFRISEGEFTNRRLFTSPAILLAGVWASGADNFALFNFLEAVQVPYVAETGVIDGSEGKALKNAEIRKMYRTLEGGIELPDPEWLLGHPIGLSVGLSKSTDQYPDVRNTINSYLVAGSAGSGGGTKNADLADLDALEEL